MLKRNWSTLLWFELLYRTMSYTLLYPILHRLLMQAMSAAGTAYISQENVAQLFKSPLSLLLLLILGLLFAFYVYFELAAIILCFEAGWQGRTISLRTLIRQTLSQSVRLVHYRNLLLYLGLIPMFALSFFRMSSSMLTAFRIPEFIMDFIQENALLFAAFGLLLAIINVYIFFFLFGLPDAIENHTGIRGALRSSRALLKGRKRRALTALILSLLGMMALMVMAAALFILVLWGYSRFYPPEQGRYIFQDALVSFGKVGNVLLDIYYTVVLLAIIIAQYHTYRGDSLKAHEKIKWGPVHLMRRLLAVAAAFVLLSVYSESEISGNLFHDPNPATEIVAHRAGAAFAPENTLAALESAIDSGANWAEIDVQQTRDGALIIMHDANFKRTTGYDANVWETDLDTVLTLDAGSYFDTAHTGERIPTLEEMLGSAKNRINLMIELKYTGHETDLVERTLALIRSTHMEDQCMIVSMNMDILQQVKAKAPGIKTAYVTALLLTDDYDLKSIDCYSVETTNLSYAMVAQAHMQQKRVYAWTANSERTIKQILKSQADGLITDNALLARYYLEDKGEFSLTSLLVNLFYPITSD